MKKMSIEEINAINTAKDMINKSDEIDDIINAPLSWREIVYSLEEWCDRIEDDTLRDAAYAVLESGIIVNGHHNVHFMLPCTECCVQNYVRDTTENLIISIDEWNNGEVVEYTKEGKEEC